MTSHPLVVQPHEREKGSSSSSSLFFFNPAPLGHTVCARSVNSVSFQSATGGLQKMSSALFLEQKDEKKSPPPYSLETNYPENNKKRKIDFREDFQHPATLGNARSDSRINYWPHPLLSKVLQLSRTYSNLVSFQVKKFQDDEHNFHPSL